MKTVIVVVVCLSVSLIVCLCFSAGIVRTGMPELLCFLCAYGNCEFPIKSIYFTPVVEMCVYIYNYIFVFHT